MHRSVPAAALTAVLLFGPATAAPPTEAPDDVAFTDVDTLTWSTVAGADRYHVYLGTDPAAADASCYRYALPGTTADVPDTPAPGGLLYLLVTAANADGAGPFGPDSTGTSRSNPSPCVDTDGDQAPDNLDNCPFDANATQADQDANGVGDRCDAATYDFESDVVGARPADMTQIGGVNTTFQVEDVAGDAAVRYGSGDGQHDRFDRTAAPASFLDTTVYLDVADVAGAASVELWSDGAFGWNAGGGIIVQVRDTGQLWFYDRRGQDVPGEAGPTVPADGRLRIRLVKGPGTTSTVHVDVRSGDAWHDDYAVFPVVDDHRYFGRSVVLADYLGGARPVLRATVGHALPETTLTLARDPSGVTDWKLFQRGPADTADVPVRFFHRLTESGRAQVRVVESLGGAVLPGFDWADHELALAPSPDGAEAALVLAGVPAGGNYDVEVRLVRDADGAIVAQDAWVELAVGDLWVAGGQSNMVGLSSLADPEPPIDTVHLFGNDYVWKRGVEPMDGGTDQVDRVSEDGAGHSLMLRFAKEMEAATGVPQAIVPGPLSGTNLYAQWQRNAADPDDRGTLYGSLLYRTLVQSDPNPPIGFLWFQGESDVGARSTEQYEADMNALIQSYRDDLGNPDLWVIQAQIGTNQLQLDIEAWVSIQEAQRRVAEGDPRVAVVPTADQPRSDTIHFSAEGYRTIGVRFAEAAREMILGEPLDASLRVLGARRVGNNRSLEIDFDGDVTGADPGLFRVREEGVGVGVKSVRISGNVVTLGLDARIDGPATVSYGYSTSPSVDWLRDLRGVAVPHFREIPVD